MNTQEGDQNKAFDTILLGVSQPTRLHQRDLALSSHALAKQ